MAGPTSITTPPSTMSATAEWKTKQYQFRVQSFLLKRNIDRTNVLLFDAMHGGGNMLAACLALANKYLIECLLSSQKYIKMNWFVQSCGARKESPSVAWERPGGYFGWEVSILNTCDGPVEIHSKWILQALLKYQVLSSWALEGFPFFSDGDA